MTKLKEQELLATCCLWELRNKICEVEAILYRYNSTFANSVENYHLSELKKKIRNTEDVITDLRAYLSTLIFEEFEKKKAESNETA